MTTDPERVDVDTDGESQDSSSGPLYADPDELDSNGVLQEANRLFFHTLGLHIEAADGGFVIEDHREKGIYFTEVDCKQVLAISALRHNHHKDVRCALGCDSWVQNPLGMKRRGRKS